jgi:hypothetical protein
MADHGPQLFLVHQLEQPGEQGDVWASVTRRNGVDRTLFDIHLRLRHIEDGAAFLQQGVQLWILGGPDPHVAGDVHDVGQPIVAVFDVFRAQPLKAAVFAQLLGGLAVQRVLEGGRRNPWQQ